MVQFDALKNYRGVSIGSILSVIFEKLLNLKIKPYLEQNIMAKFQTGGMRGKGVIIVIIDILFILRGIIYHSNYFL